MPYLLLVSSLTLRQEQVVEQPRDPWVLPSTAHPDLGVSGHAGGFAKRLLHDFIFQNYDVFSSAPFWAFKMLPLDGSYISPILPLHGPS